MKDEKMKLTQFASLLIIGLALGITATGCKSVQNQNPITKLPPEQQSNGGTTQDTSGLKIEDPTGNPVFTSTGLPANPMGSHKDYARDEKFFEANIVYFAYDSSAIRSAEKSKIEAVANYLKENPTKAVEVEGHCDERGTDQYNLALGDRRALGVREELVKLGVEATRVDTISYGRSRPASSGHTEAARAKNRRDVFVLLTPPQ